MEREETKKIAGGMTELPDEELDQVVGGKDTHYELVDRKYVGPWGKCPMDVIKVYKWEGGDINRKYFCPNCGRFVHKGSWGLFYCDPCNESWFLEDWLVPNLDAWVFKEIREQRSGDAEDLPAL